ncbi:MAG: transaldolase [Arcobacteraceae bacterium]|nr:transaldolase [Arcobacteraceae bacterium]
MSLKSKINFSLWCDFIERDFLEDNFQKLLRNDIIQGATSNPAIFEQSISTSDAYSQQIAMLQANDSKKIYEELAVTDIKRAAELLHPLYEVDSDDGFISIEVDPMLSDDSLATIEEGIRLHKTIGYDNVMIKVPATQAGYIAMEKLTSLGISVNATLIFSPIQAIECAKALNNGIKKSDKDTKAVISIFVSRFDRQLDDQLILLNIKPSKTGIVNATKCYYEIEKFNNKNIRTLFASTGVKGDRLDSSYYIENLIYPNTINTAPLDTINSFIKKDQFNPSVIISEEECNQYVTMLNDKNINIEIISEQLLKDGLESFKVSFKNMLNKLKVEN